MVHYINFIHSINFYAHKKRSKCKNNKNTINPCKVLQYVNVDKRSSPTSRVLINV